MRRFNRESLDPQTLNDLMDAMTRQDDANPERLRSSPRVSPSQTPASSYSFNQNTAPESVGPTVADNVSEADSRMQPDNAEVTGESDAEDDLKLAQEAQQVAVARTAGMTYGQILERKWFQGLSPFMQEVIRGKADEEGSLPPQEKPTAQTGECIVEERTTYQIYPEHLDGSAMTGDAVRQLRTLLEKTDEQPLAGNPTQVLSRDGVVDSADTEVFDKTAIDGIPIKSENVTPQSGKPVDVAPTRAGHNWRVPEVKHPIRKTLAVLVVAAVVPGSPVNTVIHDNIAAFSKAACEQHVDVCAAAKSGIAMTGIRR